MKTVQHYLLAFAAYALATSVVIVMPCIVLAMM
jgi:hypothetical protein